MRLLLAVSFLLAIPQLAWSSPSQGRLNPFIWGGRAASGSSEMEKIIRSSTVLIHGTTSSYQATCTGVLISVGLVLTAAHCVDGMDGLWVWSGSRWVQSTARAVHRAYVRTGSTVLNDIAVVGIPDGSLGSSYQPFQYFFGSEIPASQTLFIAGYGTDSREIGEATGADILRVAEVKFMAKNGNRILVDQRHGQGACSGDSGGPAFVSMNGVVQLVGILSTVNGGSCDQTAEYEGVANFRASDFVWSY